MSGKPLLMKLSKILFLFITALIFSISCSTPQTQNTQICSSARECEEKGFWHLKLNNNDLALKYLKASCEKSDSARNCVGLNHLKTHLNIKYLHVGKNSCEKNNDADDCEWVGTVEAETRKYKSARKYYKLACELGNVNSCGLLGILLYEVFTERKDANKYLQIFCKKNLPKDVCDKYNGLEQINLNYSKCNLNFSADACQKIGEKLDKENRDEESLKYYSLACELKNGKGCLRVAQLTILSRCPKKNEKCMTKVMCDPESKRFLFLHLERACKLGVSDACEYEKEVINNKECSKI